MSGECLKSPTPMRDIMSLHMLRPTTTTRPTMVCRSVETVYRRIGGSWGKYIVPPVGVIPGSIAKQESTKSMNK